MWEKLKRLGWSSVYGSGLVERYYLCPGVDKNTGAHDFSYVGVEAIFVLMSQFGAGEVGVNMFESEDQVREFVCREYLGEDIYTADDALATPRRKRRPSRSLMVLHDDSYVDGED